jgi:cold-inducible RNA-binding protein
MPFLEKNHMKLYVGKLPYQTTDQELADLFGQYGQVFSASVILDRETGRSKGFGFVEMHDVQEARTAMNALDHTLIGDRTIIVNEARERTSEKRDRRPRDGRNW